MKLFLNAIYVTGGLLLTLPALMVLIPLWGVNLMINAVRSLVGWGAIEWDQILRFEPRLGWQPRANLKAPYFDRIGDKCWIETDGEGWPGREPMEEADIVAFGDSFAFGYGAPGRKAYFSLTRGPRIKAIGAPGYSMVQAVMLMKRYASRLKGKTVLFFVCVENDLAENLKAYNPRFYTNPFVRNPGGGENWEIASDHVTGERWMQGGPGTSNRLLFSSLCTDSPYSDRVFSAARYLIGEAKNLCDQVGAELVVFTIPYKYQLSERGIRQLKKFLPGKNTETFDSEKPDKAIGKICGNLSVPFIAGARYLTVDDYKIRDGHWNARGNRTVAAILDRFHEDRASKAKTTTFERDDTLPFPDLRQMREGA